MDFNDFILYMNDHIEEVTYDTVNALRNEWKPTLTLSQDDISLVTKISQQNVLAILRLYHKWTKECQK